MKSKLFFFLFISFLFAACGDKEEAVSCGNFSEGAFVICEGAFVGGTGTVTFKNDELPEPCQDIYGAANSGAVVGNILQSMTIIGEKGYLVVNNANKIIVVNLKTFVSEAEIGGFESPRYLVKVSDNKAYVSQWGLDGLDGSIAVLDLSKKVITKTIRNAGSGCERFAFADNSILVANRGGFGTDSTITELDFGADTIVRKVKTGANPVGFATTPDGNIWVLSQGAYDFTTMTGSAGKLGILTSAGVTYPNASFSTLPNGVNNLAINLNGDLFFINPSAAEISIVANGTNTIKTFAKGNFYGLAVSPLGNIWATDAKDYVGAGEVVVFDADGNKKSTFKAGIIPGDVIFKF